MWKTQQERINELQTPAKYYLQNLYDALADAMIISNDILPEHLQSHKEFETGDIHNLDGHFYGTSVADINKRLNK